MPWHEPPAPEGKGEERKAPRGEFEETRWVIEQIQLSFDSREA